VRFRNTYASDQETVIPADQLVIAQGRIPVAPPNVKGLGVPARRIGDCDTPRSLEEAVLEAAIAVQELTSELTATPSGRSSSTRTWSSAMPTLTHRDG
jgi:hypothetical protein